MKSTSTLKPPLRPRRRIAAMELCTSGAISTLSHSHHHKLSYSNPSPLRSKTRSFLPLKKKITASQKNPGFCYLGTSILRSTTSEETLTSKNEPFGARDGTITSDETPEDARNTYEEVTKVEVPKEESLMGEQMQLFEVFDGLNLKLDSEETQSTLIYGSTALIGLWLASAVVGAVDSIPVVPKVLEIVGLAYTVWFSSRYLIFKENRDELLTKIEELTKQVLGTSDE